MAVSLVTTRIKVLVLVAGAGSILDGEINDILLARYSLLKEASVFDIIEILSVIVHVSTCLLRNVFSDLL